MFLPLTVRDAEACAHSPSTVISLHVYPFWWQSSRVFHPPYCWWYHWTSARLSEHHCIPETQSTPNFAQLLRHMVFLVCDIHTSVSCSTEVLSPARLTMILGYTLVNRMTIILRTAYAWPRHPWQAAPSPCQYLCLTVIIP